MFDFCVSYEIYFGVYWINNIIFESWLYFYFVVLLFNEFYICYNDFFEGFVLFLIYKENYKDCVKVDFVIVLIVCKIGCRK